MKGLALQTLDLSGTQIKDDAISFLQAIPLYNVDLSGTPVTQAGLKKLQAALPECRIEGYEPDSNEIHDSDDNKVVVAEGKAQESPAPGSPALYQPRVWSDSSGQFKLEAKFIRMEGGFAVFQRADNNREFRLTLGTLSEADRTFLQEELDSTKDSSADDSPRGDAESKVDADTAGPKPAAKTVKAVAGRNGVLAIAGFNNRKGLGVRRGKRGPYQLDQLSPSAGTGEGGWNGPWSATEKATAQSRLVYEGDGALHLEGTASVRRGFAGPLSGIVEIEQYVLVPADGHVIVYVVESNNISSGPVWSVNDGKFLALAGDERGSGDWIRDGVAAKVDEWHRVVVEVDTDKRRWKLKVPELDYTSAELKYRGAPKQLLGVHYLAETRAGVFIDAIQIRHTKAK